MATIASPTPVLPDVGSMIVPPGRSAPEASAASTIRSAILSFTEPPGLMYSTLASTAGTPAWPRRVPGLCPADKWRVTLRSRSSGVFPMRSIRDSCTCMAAKPSRNDHPDRAGARGVPGRPAWLGPAAGIARAPVNRPQGTKIKRALPFAVTLLHSVPQGAGTAFSSRGGFVALLLADQEGWRSHVRIGRQGGPPPEHFSPCVPALGPFRAAVGDLVTEIGQSAPADARAAEHVLAKRLRDDEFAIVL